MHSALVVGQYTGACCVIEYVIVRAFACVPVCVRPPRQRRAERYNALTTIAGVRLSMPCDAAFGPDRVGRLSERCGASPDAVRCGPASLVRAASKLQERDRDGVPRDMHACSTLRQLATVRTLHMPPGAVKVHRGGTVPLQPDL